MTVDLDEVRRLYVETEDSVDWACDPWDALTWLPVLVDEVEQLRADINALLPAARLYLTALDTDPEHEYLTLPEAMLVTALRDAVARHAGPGGARSTRTVECSMTSKWRVRHPGIGVLAYGSEAEARIAAGTAGEVLPPPGRWLLVCGADRIPPGQTYGSEQAAHDVIRLHGGACPGPHSVQFVPDDPEEITDDQP